MSRFFQNRAAGGFRLDSPVKVPVASEMPRCAPPHTNGAGEEPCPGGRAETKAPERVSPQALLFGSPFLAPLGAGLSSPTAKASVFLRRVLRRFGPRIEGARFL